jgi:hypothetical protein
MLFSNPVLVGEMNDAEMPRFERNLIAVVIGKLAFESNLYPLLSKLLTNSPTLLARNGDTAFPT